MTPAEACCSIRNLRNAGGLESFVSRWLPLGPFRRILIKPNWVLHQQDPAFPIDALVTSSELIDAVLEACLEKYPTLDEITVGDVPLQSCDWDLLVRQSGVDRLIAKYQGYRQPRIYFRDLRRESVLLKSGYMVPSAHNGHGDPRGYQEIRLDQDSYLEEISHSKDRFRVSDYSPHETSSSHSPGFHRYLIARSALECDLFINLPKMKTHQKSGLTGALKNLVGINGNKAYLVHHRLGKPADGGDEFPPNVSSLIRLQNRLREQLQSRSRLAFSILRPGWNALKKLAGIRTQGTSDNLDRKFYIAAGSWYGNDTVWRMIYDLNRIIRYGHPNLNKLSNTPQREYVAILDGVTAGEGNGPLQPLPVSLRVVAAARDPFLLDTVAARLMGFDPQSIPMLSARGSFLDPEWGHFDSARVPIEIDGDLCLGIDPIPVMHRFRPAPGWKGHIELQRETVVA